MKNAPTLTICIALCLLCVCFSAQAVEYNDIDGHWAEETIRAWSDSGLLQGYDGKFRPDDHVTTAELCTVIQRILSYPEPAELEFDLDPAHWATGTLNALLYHRPSSGTASRLMAPDKVLNRTQAFQIIVDCFHIYWYFVPEKPGTLEELPPAPFRDLAMGGLIVGYPDGTYGSKEPITRAEVITILDRMFENVVDEPGTYTFPQGSKVVVTAPEVTIENSALDFLLVMGDASAGPIHLKNSSMAAWSIHIADEKEKNEAIFYDSAVDNPYFRAERAMSGGCYWFKPLRDTTLFAGGIGTENNPYRIETEEHLKNITLYRSSHFEITNDITLTEPWVPIGNTKDPKTFDYTTFATIEGNGHVIRNLKFDTGNRAYENFGFIAIYSGTMRNLTLEGELTLCDGESGLGDYGNQPSLGLFAGRAGHSITVTEGGAPFAGYEEYGPVSHTYEGAATFINCHAKVTIKGTTEQDVACGVGGFAGVAQDVSISDCSAQVEIDIAAAGKIVTGGLFGIFRNGEAVGCAANGSIVVRQLDSSTEEQSINVGGAFGGMSAKATACHAAVDINAYGCGYMTQVGGFMGGTSEKELLLVERCSASGSVTARGDTFQNNAGGFSAQFRGTISECTASGTVTILDSPAINVAGGLCSGVYGDSIVNNCYATGSVTIENDYLPWAGGITGRNEGNITNSYGLGGVAAVASRRGTGGTVIQSALIQNKTVSFTHDADPDSVSAVANNQAAFEERGWDFQSIWKWSASLNRPVLRWESS